MATVHIGRLVGDAGFARTVAIKKLHAQFAKDPEFREMFLDEAHLASRIRHPNVVATLDVVDAEDLLLVMEYVPADSLARLLKIVASRKDHVPLRVAASVAVQVLHGLHAAHEATSEAGEPLALVHRDVSPQNVLVGTDGISRVLDFGVAKAIGRMHTTREGVIKGKLAYMSPEQLGGKGIDRRCDVYAASVLFWEMLTATRLFATGDEGETYGKVLRGASTPPSKVAPGVPQELDTIVMRGLAIEPDARFATARDMARAIEASIPMATASEVGEWVESVASDVLRRRAERVRQIESGVEASGGDAIAERMDTGAEVATGATMSLQSEPATRGGRSKMALAAVAALALVGVAGAGAWWKWPGAGGGAPVASATPSVEASALPSELPGATDPTASALPPSTPSSTSRTVGLPSGHVVPARLPPPRCRPPYYFDPDGTKHYKKECI